MDRRLLQTPKHYLFLEKTNKTTMNKHIFLYTIVLLSLVITQKATAQDVHFSQQYAAPLYVNPAMTGLMQGNMRGSIIYRNQWASAMGGAPYRTIYGSADMALSGLGDYDRLAVGLMVYNDKGGEVAFQTNYIDLSLAYNLGLSPNAYLSLGLEGGVSQRGVDLSNAQFGNQFDGNNYTPTISAEEGFETLSRWRANVAAGAMFYMGLGERSNLFLGGGLYHFTNPDISFTGLDRDQVSSKLSIQAGGKAAIGKQFDLLPTLYFLKQGTHTQINVGTWARYIFDRNRHNGLEKAFGVGLWSRMANSITNFGMDAIILGAKIDYNQFAVGLTYDITTSALSVGNAGQGGPEIALTYVAPFKERRSSRIECPKF